MRSMPVKSARPLRLAGGLFALAAVVAGAMVGACSGSGGGDSGGGKGPRLAGSGGASSESTGSGGQGGEATATSSSQSSSKAASVTATSATGTGGAGGSGPLICKGDYAYGATSLTYLDDTTPPGLVAAFGSLTAPATGHSLTLVLHQPAGGTLIGAVSATQQGASGSMDVFASDETPALMDVTASFDGGFTQTGPQGHENDPQPFAWLHLVDQQGPVDIKLTGIHWTAHAQPGCTMVTVDVTGSIPVSEAGLVLHLASGDKTLYEASGEAFDGGKSPLGMQQNVPAPVHIEFEATSTSFDFTTLAGQSSTASASSNASSGSAGG